MDKLNLVGTGAGDSEEEGESDQYPESLTSPGSIGMRFESANGGNTPNVDRRRAFNLIQDLSTTMFPC